MANALPIGMFDSGLGGLTVMRQLVRELPNENILYFGDTARLPYGSKSPETIVRYSLEIADFLMDRGVKMIVVACNTASSHALSVLRERYPVPVIGVIEPGAEAAVQATSNGRIAVLGTRGTIRSNSYQKAISQLSPGAEVVPVACPLFVPLVEENYISFPAAQMIVREYLKPLSGKEVDTVLLGCTHYPLLKDLIAEALDKRIRILDSASSCAKWVAEILDENGLSNNESAVPEYTFYVSDDPDKFQELGKVFLGRSVEDVMLYDIAAKDDAATLKSSFT